MTKEEFEYAIKSCGFLIHRGHIYYEESELIKAFEDLGLIEKEPCDDCISRPALLKLMGEEPFNWTDSVQELQAVEDYRNFRNMVEQLPSVKPQEKTGHWIEQDIHNCHTEFKCSACGYIHSFMHLYGKPTADYTYCPNCGAKMVEPQERSE